MKRSGFARRISTTALFVAPVLYGGDVQAGHKHQSTAFVPVLVQQAPATTQIYSAPTTMQVFSAPATTQVYSAPATTQVYSAPATQVYSAPATTTQVYSAPAAGGTVLVGNAPVAGAKIDPVDRDDIISELRKEAREGADGTSMRERRKALRESARTKYAEAIGDESDLTEADEQDIAAVVNAILSPNSTIVQGGQALLAPTATTTTFVGSAPAATTSYVSYAPALLAPQPTMFVQPLAPVQLLVPVQPKHHWLHK